MKKTKVILFIIFILFTGAQAQDDPKSIVICTFEHLKVGCIFKIDGTGRLLRKSKKERKLDSKSYYAELESGEQVTSDKDSKIFIKLCNGKQKTVRNNESYTVPPIDCPTLRERRPAKDGPLEEGGYTLKSKFYRFIDGENLDLKELLGWDAKSVPKKDGSFGILTPLPFNSLLQITTVLRLRDIKFRWTPVPAQLNISVFVSGDSSPIWQQAGVDGRFGFYTSDGLKNALKKIAEKRFEEYLELQIRDPEDIVTSAKFKILSSKDEELIQNELDLLETENELLRRIGRALIFESYDLYSEAAVEYEKALSFSKNSVDLLTATARAQANAGNFGRSIEIRNKIVALRKENPE